MGKSFHVQHYSRKTMLGLGPVEHRWRAVHDRNHEIMAHGEGYQRLPDLKATCIALFGTDIRFEAVPR